MPVGWRYDHVSTEIDTPAGHNAALLIKIHRSTFFQGLKRLFQALVQSFVIKI
jgi:hypothetical protein